MRQHVPLFLATATSWLVAGLWRLRSLEQVSIGSDSLGPFLAAWSLQWDHLPMPPNPEGGFSLWVTAWPLVHMAPSLEHLFALRFWQAALIAPVTLLTTHRITNHLPMACLAAAVVSVDGGLSDTLVSSFRGYGAPEWIALAGLAFAWSRSTAGALFLIPVALVSAAGQHPFATGAALALVCVLPRVWREHTATTWLVMAVLTVLCCMPRLWWITVMAECPQGSPFHCLSTVAWGSSEMEQSRMDLLWRAIRDRSFETTFATLPIALGVLAALRSTRRVGLWGLGAVMGIVILGLSVHSLRPYHLRIAAAPLAVAAAAGWLQLGRMGWPMGIAAVSLMAFSSRPLGQPGNLRVHDQLGRAVMARAPAWVDAAWRDGEWTLEPSAVALSAVLQGMDVADLRPAETHPVLLLINGDNGPSPSTTQQSALWFDDANQAQTWLTQQPDMQGVGVCDDWVQPFFPHGHSPSVVFTVQR